VGLALGILVAELQTPEYRAGAMLQIEPPTPVFMSVSDALMGSGGYWQNADFYNTQFKIMRSRGLGEKVVESLSLKDKPPFQGLPDPGGAFMGYVSVEPIPESRLVMVQVTHTDPQAAALWANTLADVYIEQSLSSRVESARRAYQWLQERLSSTQKNMQEAHERLIQSYRDQDLYVPEGSVSALTSAMTKLNDDHVQAQSRRIALEAALKQVEDLRRAKRDLDAVPQVSSDGIVSDLNGEIATLSLQLSQLKGQFREGHPEVQRVQARLQEINRVKEGRATQVVEGLRSEYTQIRGREAELERQLNTLKNQAVSQSRKSTELDTLKKEAESAKSLYEVLLQKLSETDIAASIKTASSTIVERASAPLSPVRPAKRRIALTGILIGFVVGIGLVFTRDYFANTIKSPDEIERYLHLDLIASVPKYDEANVHLVTEAYQNLRTALLFGRKEEGGQVVLVCGTAPQEGKTTTLVNIGKLLATSGEKTVLLDFDLRRAQVHARLGLPREPGITNFFAHHEDLDALIQTTRVPNLYALTAGPLPPNPPAILTRRNFPDLLEHLRRHFDWVLLDSPPLASVTDALLLGRYADITVLVVQHNKVDKRLIKRHLTSLRRVAPNVLGVVLNAVNVEAKGYYYQYYYDHEQSSGTGATAGAGTEGESRKKVAAQK
jgi:capsular exopolysaccharide synthesis family protein